jgi:ATP-dependent DNA helicase RecG
MAALDSIEVQFVKGVGPRRARILHSLGVDTVMDLLRYYPRRYRDRRQVRLVSQLQDGQEETVRGKVLACGLKRLSRGITLFQIAVGDESGVVYGTWFNQPYMQSRFATGQEVILSGKVRHISQWQILSPEYEILNEEGTTLLNTGRIVPVYALREGLNQRSLRKIIYDCLNKYAGSAPEILCPEIREELRFDSPREALYNIHFPETPAALERARRRLVFDEFFLTQMAVVLKKKQLSELRGTPKRGGGGALLHSFLRSLPFTLTRAQERVLEEIRRDMEASKPMNRLLQGDVGSGKTVVAIAALLISLDAGYQGVLMAPTEILAEQHYRTVKMFLESLGVKTHLLIGEMSTAEKEETHSVLRAGEPVVVVGTHAVIQREVEFARLGIVIVDEQHKFGVMQRARLRGKGMNPDFMIMTATPIPRTLALTLYGELDISVLDEMPPGRGTVSTHWVPIGRLEETYGFIHREALKGRQAYIIYPLIEESGELSLSAASEMAEMLRREHFPDLRVGLIHGRMRREVREGVMNDFRNGILQVLVATSVIEVGLDVPRACIMLVEHAERFGLSQLHQMRGRIGRGRQRSYFFFSGTPTSEDGRKRLKALQGTSDGFHIAQLDMEIRGPGEFFSDRQHGGPDFRLADMRGDEHLLKLSRGVALRVSEEDRRLKRAEHTHLREALVKRYRGRFQLGITG